jgi:hypothetical protein
MEELYHEDKVVEAEVRKKGKKNPSLTKSMSIGDKAVCGFDKLGMIEEGTNISAQ